MAFRGAAICLGKQQAHNRTTTSTTCLLLSIPRHLRTSSSSSYHHVSATANPFKISNQLPQIKKKVRYYSVQATSGTAAQPVTRQNNNNNKVKEEEEDPSSQNWKIKMLYDGECPLCMREVDMLRERNKTYGTIKFVDISSDEYSDKDNQGLDYKTVMGRIHAILSDGTVVTDVEAFRKLYEAVGLGWVYAITKYEPIASIANAVYGFWAKYRLQVTGRPPLEEVLEVRRKKQTCGDSKDCKI